MRRVSPWAGTGKRRIMEVHHPEQLWWPDAGLRRHAVCVADEGRSGGDLAAPLLRADQRLSAALARF